MPFQISDVQISIQEATTLPTFATLDIGAYELKTELLVFVIDHDFFILLPLNKNLEIIWQGFEWINQTKLYMICSLCFHIFHLNVYFRFRMFYVNVFSCAA